MPKNNTANHHHNHNHHHPLKDHLISYQHAFTPEKNVPKKNKLLPLLITLGFISLTRERKPVIKSDLKVTKKGVLPHSPRLLASGHGSPTS